MIVARAVAGALIMLSGFWMVAVATPPDAWGGWSLVSIVLMAVGAIVSTVAALDLMDDRR